MNLDSRIYEVVVNTAAVLEHSPKPVEKLLIYNAPDLTLLNVTTPIESAWDRSGLSIPYKVMDKLLVTKQVSWLTAHCRLVDKLISLPL